MMEQPRSIRDQIVTMFMKIAAKTISREEGTLLLNDLARGSINNKMEVFKVILDLCQKPPKDVYVKTMFHTVALAKNPAFTKILEVGLEHKNEEISIVCADGLANLGNDEARDSLTHHLINDSYHVRKASGDVLIKGWGKMGIKLVIANGLSHPETYYRYTAALSLARSGKAGISALLDVFISNNLNAIQSAAEALSEFENAVGKEDVPKIVHALEVAVANKHSNAVVALLKLLGAMKEKVGGFEEHIAVLMDHSYEPVRVAAHNALASVATEKANLLLSSPKTPKEQDIQHSYYSDNNPRDHWIK